MNLVDSCGWLEYFADGPNAAFFANPLEEVASLVVPTICVYEVFRRLLSQIGRSGALEAVAMMRQATIVPLSDTVAMQAAGIGMETKMAMADSIIVATARLHGATIWTQDSHFAELPGVRYKATKK